MRVRSVKALSDLIAGSRKRIGLTQSDLADQVMVSRKTISEIESGNIDGVSASTLFKAMRFAGLDIDVSEKVADTAEEISQKSAMRRSGPR